MKNTKLMILMLLISLFMFGTGCSKYGKSDLQEMEIKAKVGSMREVMFGAVDIMGKIGRDVFIYDSYYTFNNKGFITEIISYQSDGSIEHSQQYKRDKKMRIIEMNTVSDDGTHHIKEVYSYDDQGNNTARSRYSAKNELIEKNIFAYDKLKNIIESARYDSSGNLVEKKLYTYDRKNRKTDSKTFDHNGQLISYDTFRYPSASEARQVNKLGKVKELRHYGANEAFEYACGFAYNNHADLNEEYYHSVDQSETTYIYKYEYNKDNNWTRKVTYRNAIPHSIVERSYNVPNNAKPIPAQAEAHAPTEL